MFFFAEPYAIYGVNRHPPITEKYSPHLTHRETERYYTGYYDDGPGRRYYDNNADDLDLDDFSYGQSYPRTVIRDDEYYPGTVVRSDEYF